VCASLQILFYEFGGFGWIGDSVEAGDLVQLISGDSVRMDGVGEIQRDDVGPMVDTVRWRHGYDKL